MGGWNDCSREEKEDNETKEENANEEEGTIQSLVEAFLNSTRSGRQSRRPVQAEDFSYYYS